MKHTFAILAAVFLFGGAASHAKADVSISVDFFYDNLEAYGDWREVGDYGYCWQPRDIDRNWSPYSNGRWLYTDAGWTWDSDEPYAWAVYHYGRWANIDGVGWVWVPGTEWGPAWVSWRRNSQYVGWAPLPPEARFSASSGFGERVDVDYDIGPTNYNFVVVRDFGSPRLREHIVERQKNVTIIRRTTNITNITYVNNTVYNGGPQYAVISKESAQPIRRLKLERQERRDTDPRTLRSEELRSRVKGDSLRVVALPISKARANAPRKVVAKIPAANVNHGWKNAGTESEIAKARNKVNAPGPAEAPGKQMPPQTDRSKNKPEAGLMRTNPKELPPNAPELRHGKEGGKRREPRQPEMRPTPNQQLIQSAPILSEPAEAKSKAKKHHERAIESPAFVPPQNAPREKVQAPKPRDLKRDRVPKDNANKSEGRRKPDQQKRDSKHEDSKHKGQNEVANRAPSGPPAAQHQAPQQHEKGKGKNKGKEKHDQKPDSAPQ